MKTVKMVVLSGVSFLSLMTTIAQAQVYVVGNGALPQGAIRVSALNQIPFSSLVAGSKIFLSSGTYTGGFTIAGARNGTAANPIIVDALDTSNPPVINVSVDIQNSQYLKVQNLVVNNSTYSGIILRSGSNHISVVNNKISSAGQAGIQVSSESFAVSHLIQGNTITNASIDGIYVDKNISSSTDQIQIINNTITGSATHGIEILASYVTVTGNKVYGSGRTIGGSSGIHLYSDAASASTSPYTALPYCDHVTISKNYVSGTRELQYYDGNGIELDHFCDSNLVQFNVITGNDGHGIIAFDSQNNIIRFNTVYGNSVDLNKQHSTNGAILSNVAEITLSTGGYNRTTNNYVYDNIAVATHALITDKYHSSSAIFIDENTALNQVNYIGPNMMYHTAGGTILRYTFSYFLTTTASINSYTKTSGNIVAMPDFVNATLPVSGGLRLKSAAARGKVIANLTYTDYANESANTASSIYLGAYYNLLPTSTLNVTKIIRRPTSSDNTRVQASIYTGK
jgi:parallel beta-helix repeat protein